jgi:hypothetical protein
LRRSAVALREPNDNLGKVLLDQIRHVLDAQRVNIFDRTVDIRMSAHDRQDAAGLLTGSDPLAMSTLDFKAAITLLSGY